MVITGQIIDNSSNKPISGAKVAFLSTNQDLDSYTAANITSDEGMFVLNVDDNIFSLGGSVQLSCFGYSTLILSPSAANGTIKLTRNAWWYVGEYWYTGPIIIIGITVGLAFLREKIKRSK